MQYLSPLEAQNRVGIRLVLTGGAFNAWCESAEAIFRLKDLPYLPVVQEPFGDNAALVEWTGIRNAPQAICDDEPPCSRWEQILFLAERLEPSVPLIPSDSQDRVLMLGICQEICGEQGFGWSVRLDKMEPLCRRMPSGDPDVVRIFKWSREYGYRQDQEGAGAIRAAATMEVLAGQLARQAERQSAYLVGQGLSAADIYWAVFSEMVKPLARTVRPLDEPTRATFRANSELLARAVERWPQLFAHRDMIYAKYL